MYDSYRFVWFLGIPMCLGIIMTAENFVPWFFGPGYERVIPLLRILSVLVLSIGINTTTGGQLLVQTKRQNILTITVFVGAGVNVVMNIFLIRVFRSAGAAIASVAAETVIAILQLVLVRHELSMMIILRESFNYVVAGIGMVLVLLPISRALTPSIVHTLMIVVAGIASYFAILLIERDKYITDWKIEHRNRDDKVQ